MFFKLISLGSVPLHPTLEVCMNFLCFWRLYFLRYRILSLKRIFLYPDFSSSYLMFLLWNLILLFPLYIWLRPARQGYHRIFLLYKGCIITLVIITVIFCFGNKKHAVLKHLLQIFGVIYIVVFCPPVCANLVK